MIVRNFVLIFIFLFFFSLVNAEVFVNINSKTGEIYTIYPFEIALFDLTVINSGLSEVESLTFSVISEENKLFFIDEGKELTELNFDLKNLKPNEKIVKEIKIKSKDVSDKKVIVTVRYGEKIFTHEISTFINVVKSSFTVKPKLNKNVLNNGEETSIVLDLENKGEKAITDLSAKLILPNGFELVSEPSIPLTLDPGKSSNNLNFQFKANKTQNQLHTLVMQVSFKEEGVIHLLEYSFQIEVGNKIQLFLTILLGITIGLIVLRFLIKENKPKINPIKEGQIKEGNHNK